MKNLILFIALIITGFSYSQKIEIVDFPDVEAEFRGGSKAMSSFIRRTIKYPEICREKGLEGKVYVEFTVLKNGKITNIKTVKGQHPCLNNEAERVVERMPKWKPAKVAGKKVNVKCRIPFTFSLK